MGKCNKFLMILLLCVILSGCASWFVRVPVPIIQEEDKIYTVREGTILDVYYDNQKITLTLPQDRFLVTRKVLTGEAAKFIDATLDKVKFKADQKKMLAILGSILGILLLVLGIIFKAKSWFPKKITATVESK